MQLLGYDDFHPYQKRAVAKAIRVEGGFLFLDTGMGKTVISLAIHDQLKKRERIRKSLVIAPKFVMQNVWRQQALEWDFSKDFTFSVIHGSTYRGSAEYSRRMALLDDVDIHLLNYDGLLWMTRYIHNPNVPFPWQCVFYDESTRMKRNNKRFKAWKKFMDRFDYRFCLTGTPMPNGLQDIFGQAYVIDQGAALATGITSFRQKFLVPKYQVNDRVTVYKARKGAKTEVAKKIAWRTVRLKKTEHLKLPPVRTHLIHVTLPPAVRDVYDEFKANEYMDFGGVEIETFSKVATDMKLRQFLQGSIYDKQRNVVKLHDVKLQALKSIKLDGNALVAYHFRFERDDLRSATGSNHYLDGGTKDSDAEKWIIDWNNYSVPYFLVNPASAAFGLNLQAGGNNIIWYALTWDAEHYTQLIDRLWRQGQRKAVNVYHIVCKKTIDEVIVKALMRKDASQEALMRDIVNYMHRR